MQRVRRASRCYVSDDRFHGPVVQLYEWTACTPCRSDENSTGSGSVAQFSCCRARDEAHARPKDETAIQGGVDHDELPSSPPLWMLSRMHKICVVKCKWIVNTKRSSSGGLTGRPWVHQTAPSVICSTNRARIHDWRGRSWSPYKPTFFPHVPIDNRNNLFGILYGILYTVYGIQYTHRPASKNHEK